MKELTVGFTAVDALTQQFEIMGGADLMPYSKGVYEVRQASGEADVKRKEVFGLRVGVLFRPSPRGEIRFQLSVLSEEGFLLGALFKI